MSLQSLECLLCHVWHLCPVDSLSSLLRTDRFLGDARFDLQINNIPHGSEDTGRNTFGTCFGETGLKIRPDVFRHDNCEQKKHVLLCKMSPASHFFLLRKAKKKNEICSQLS